MESVDEARKVILEIGKANGTAEDPPPITVIAEKLGMNEDMAEQVALMAVTLDQRSIEAAMLQLMRGNAEAVGEITAGVIGTACLIGYRLGCSHTAERMTDNG